MNTGTVFLYTAIIITLFLIVYFCVKVRSWLRSLDVNPGDSASHMQDFAGIDGDLSAEDIEYEQEEIEELEAVPDIQSAELQSVDLLSDTGKEQIGMAMRPPGNSNVKIAFGDDDIPFLVESSGIELVDGGMDDIIHIMEDELSPKPAIAPEHDGVVDLEDIPAAVPGSVSIFRQPFAFSAGNPKLLPKAAYEVQPDVPGDVLFEKNGIHYISSNVYTSGNNSGKELNSDFEQLVKSVVKKN